MGALVIVSTEPLSVGARIYRGLDRGERRCGVTAERPVWLPGWCVRSAEQIQAVSEQADRVGLAAVKAERLPNDPVWLFANAVNAVISWAFVVGVPAPTRGETAPGPAQGPGDVRRELDLTVMCLPDTPEELWPFGHGVVACCEWLLGVRDEVAYPGLVA
jgi:hypothetical protein